MNYKHATAAIAALSMLGAWTFAQNGAGSASAKSGSTSQGSKKGLPNSGQLPGGKQAAPKPPWQEFKLNPKTTIFLDFTDSNPDMIISIFSRTSGITILKDPAFKTPLTVTSAKAVSLNEAFEIFNTVLGMNNYELQKKDNLMIVARKMPPQGPPMMAPPPPPQPIIKTYPLKNANASQVARVINEMFAASTPAPGGGGGPSGLPPGIIINGVPGGGGPGGTPGGAAKPSVKASSEDYSNSVVVIAMPQDQTKIEALIADLDKPTAQPLQSEFFHLKYVPAEEVLSVVEDVLTANTPTGRAMGKKNDNQNGSFFFGFNPFGNNNQHTAGGQSATAIKATNCGIL